MLFPRIFRAAFRDVGLRMVCFCVVVRDSVVEVFVFCDNNIVTGRRGGAMYAAGLCGVS